MMCPVCGTELWADKQLCPHHEAIDLGESATNRIMCDFLHRKVIPKRVTEDWTEAWTGADF